MKRKFGFGTTSLMLFILAMIWPSNIKWLNDFCLGDVVLDFINLPAWSTNSIGRIGVHHTVYYTFVILILAIIVGHKFPEHIFAKLGKILATIYTVILLFFLFVSCMTIGRLSLLE